MPDQKPTAEGAATGDDWEGSGSEGATDMDQTTSEEERKSRPGEDDKE